MWGNEVTDYFVSAQLNKPAMTQNCHSLVLGNGSRYGKHNKQPLSTNTDMYLVTICQLHLQLLFSPVQACMGTLNALCYYKIIVYL